MTDAPAQLEVDAPTPPGPSLDELYGLYVSFMAHERKKWMAEFSKYPNIEEQVAVICQPKSKERFAEYLEECGTRGVRQCLIDTLLLGPEFVDAHPSDPRLQSTPQHQEHIKRQFEAGWAQGIDRLSKLGLVSGRQGCS